jgi:hypothetical protein
VAGLVYQFTYGKLHGFGALDSDSELVGQLGIA